MRPPKILSQADRPWPWTETRSLILVLCYCSEGLEPSDFVASDGAETNLPPCCHSLSNEGSKPEAQQRYCKDHPLRVPTDLSSLVGYLLSLHSDQSTFQRSVESLKYAYEHSCPWHEDSCNIAAEKWSLECLRYAREHGCPWNESTCFLAADFRQIDCSYYAHEHGCPWHKDTCDIAPQRGTLDCLRYAHEHSCFWTRLLAIWL